MDLLVVSHKVVWRDPASTSGYSTIGGFPTQIAAISSLFDRTRLCVPCHEESPPPGCVPLVGSRLEVVPLSAPNRGSGRRPVILARWLARNLVRLATEVRRADAVPALLPGA